MRARRARHSQSTARATAHAPSPAAPRSGRRVRTRRRRTPPGWPATATPAAPPSAARSRARSHVRSPSGAGPRSSVPSPEESVAQCCGAPPVPGCRPSPRLPTSQICRSKQRRRRRRLLPRYCRRDRPHLSGPVGRFEEGYGQTTMNSASPWSAADPVWRMQSSSTVTRVPSSVSATSMTVAEQVSSSPGQT